MGEPSTQPVLIWITNMAPPYRAPLWRALAVHARLEVRLLQRDSASVRARTNRGDDWAAQNASGSFTTRILRTVSLPIGQSRVYISGLMRRRDFTSANAVVLGGWDSPAYWLASSAARRAGVRRVGFYESHALSRKHSGGVVHRIRMRFFRSLDAIVVPGIAARDALIADGIESSRIWTGFNAVDVAGIAAGTSQARAAVREAGHPSQPGLRVLYVGQLIARKNVHALLSAMTGLSDARLTIVGVGEERAALEESASILGARATFTGQVANAELPALLARHDVLVLPSVEEVWGLVVNEALAAGLRCIVSNRAGVAPSVEGMAGVQVVEPTTDAISEALRTVAKGPLTPIADPQILRETPEAFAAVFLAASEISVA